MVYYNTSFMDTNNTFFDIFQSVNELSNGWIIGLLLFVMFIIMVIAMKHYNSKIAFLVASFITTVIGIGFMFTGMIGLSIIIYFIIGTIASLLYYLFSGDN